MTTTSAEHLAISHRLLEIAMKTEDPKQIEYAAKCLTEWVALVGKAT